MCVLLLLAWSMLPGCRTPPRNDLEDNRELYRSPRYTAALPADRDVMVLPLADERGPPALEASKVVVSLMPEGVWSRPLPVMLDAVVRKEITESKVFRSVLPTARHDCLLLKPVLVDGHGAIVEEIHGRYTYAQLAIRIDVFGPSDGQGQRRKIFTETYSHRQVGDRAMRPISPMILTGMCLQRIVSTMLHDIDTQNLARNLAPFAPLDDK